MSGILTRFRFIKTESVFGIKLSNDDVSNRELAVGMVVKARRDIAMLFSGEGKDADIYTMASRYLQSASFAPARHHCYAIMGHGNPGEIAGQHISDAISEIHQAYNSYGNNRVLLVLSCALGYGSARMLATRLKTDVMAARAAISIGRDSIELSPESGAITMSQGIGKDLVRLQSRNDWVYVRKDGTMTLDSEAAPGGAPVTINLGNAGAFFNR